MGLIELEDVTLLIDTEDYDSTYMTAMNISPEKQHDADRLKLDNLNWFISDDLINRAEQKVLLFYFSAPSQHFILHDIMSFLLSQLQRHFNEYRCEAVLKIEGNAP
jgi:hypothetical protein